MARFSVFLSDQKPFYTEIQVLVFPEDDDKHKI